MYFDKKIPKFVKKKCINPICPSHWINFVAKILRRNIYYFDSINKSEDLAFHHVLEQGKLNISKFPGFTSIEDTIKTLKVTYGHL